MTALEDQKRVAALLEATAAELAPLMVELAAHHRPDVWTGRRAERFGREMQDQHRLLRTAAEQLRREATDLRTRADAADVYVGSFKPR